MNEQQRFSLAPDHSHFVPKSNLLELVISSDLLVTTCVYPCRSLTSVVQSARHQVCFTRFSLVPETIHVPVVSCNLRSVVVHLSPHQGYLMRGSPVVQVAFAVRT
jgi:hypothetical protein